MKSEFLPERNMFRVVCDTPTGPVSKLMSPADYMSFLDSSLQGMICKDDEKRGLIEPTPNEFLRARFDPLEVSGCVAYRLPAGTFPILRAGKEGCMVAFPDTLWHIKVRRRAVLEIHLFCLFEKDLTDNTILWRLPLPNVYGDGKICLGGNQWKFENFNQFFELVHRFFSAPHNGDLFNAREQGMTFDELLPILECDGITEKTAKPVGTLGECKRKLAAFR